MIVKLGETEGIEVGGKASGLSKLIQLGLPVAAGFVLPGREADLEKAIRQIILELGDSPKAVRSSALEEDGEEASFAGQFETILNCQGQKEIIEAVSKCRISANESRVQAYSSHFDKTIESHIPIIIQNMIPAEKAGVLFTANPVNQRRDQWVINATSGLAEDLVAGKDSGEQYLLSENGKVINKGKLLSNEEISLMYRQARIIHEHYGHPVDLEWAIDDSGQLTWLQARPVSTLSDVHLNELDGGLFQKDEIFTRGNIGEMMPGPVTPLTYSVFGRAIEVGLQDFFIASGAQKEFTDEWLYFRMFYNHLFFSMTSMYEITRHVLLNKKENVEFSIMGETLDDGKKINKASLTGRIWNQWRQFRYLSSGIKRMHKLENINKEFQIKETDDLEILYTELSRSLKVLNSAYAHHYCASSQSGSYHSAMMQILGKGKTKPSVEDHKDAASLLADIQGVEGANLILALETLVGKIRSNEAIKTWLLAVEREEFNKLLLENKSFNDQGKEKFLDSVRDFLKDHGHRCIREAELRQKSWSEEPGQLLDIIQKYLQTVSSRNTTNGKNEKIKKEIQSKLSLVQKYSLGMILPRARTAVARREYTKSMCISIQYRIKKGYLRLAELMVAKGLLKDIDQIFFLSHEELGEYLYSGNKKLFIKSLNRRKLFPESVKLQFPDVSTGKPAPFDSDRPLVKINGNSVAGIPVSAGKIIGPIRVIEQHEDASKLLPGDIMVCQYTDVGWTPYFSLIGGLVTEIGSPLSHGAVVAREYGIPAVVSVKGAMQFFKDGDTVELNGENGVIKKQSIHQDQL